MADAAGAAIGDVSSAARDTNAAIARISNAAREQAAGATAIVVSVEAMSGSMQRAAFSLDEQTAGNRDLLAAVTSVRDLAQHVEAAIGRQEAAFTDLSRASADLMVTSDLCRDRRGAVDDACDALERQTARAAHDPSGLNAAIETFAARYRELDDAEVRREADAGGTRAPYQVVVTEIQVAHEATSR